MLVTGESNKGGATILPVKELPRIQPPISIQEEVKILPVENHDDGYLNENKCPVCSRAFMDVQSLIDHSQVHFAPPVQTDHASFHTEIQEACPI
jgi:hypothetical protein